MSKETGSNNGIEDAKFEFPILDTSKKPASKKRAEPTVGPETRKIATRFNKEEELSRRDKNSPPPPPKDKRFNPIKGLELGRITPPSTPPSYETVTEDMILPTVSSDLQKRIQSLADEAGTKTGTKGINAKIKEGLNTQIMEQAIKAGKNVPKKEATKSSTYFEDREIEAAKILEKEKDARIDRQEAKIRTKLDTQKSKMTPKQLKEEEIKNANFKALVKELEKPTAKKSKDEIEDAQRVSLIEKFTKKPQPTFEQLSKDLTEEPTAKKAEVDVFDQASKLSKEDEIKKMEGQLMTMRNKLQNVKLGWFGKIPFVGLDIPDVEDVIKKLDKQQRPDDRDDVTEYRNLYDDYQRKIRRNAVTREFPAVGAPVVAVSTPSKELTKPSIFNKIGKGLLALAAAVGIISSADKGGNVEQPDENEQPTTSPTGDTGSKISPIEKITDGFGGVIKPESKINRTVEPVVDIGPPDELSSPTTIRGNRPLTYRPISHPWDNILDDETNFVPLLTPAGTQKKVDRIIEGGERENQETHSIFENLENRPPIVPPQTIGQTRAQAEDIANSGVITGGRSRIEINPPRTRGRTSH